MGTETETKKINKERWRHIQRDYIKSLSYFLGREKLISVSPTKTSAEYVGFCRAELDSSWNKEFRPNPF